MLKFKITGQLKDNHKEQLLEMYQHEWWSTGRTKADIETILNNISFIIGIIDNETDSLIAFSRILTDHFKYAYIYDLIVEKSYRKQGLSNLILNSIINHPKLKNIQNIELVCRKELIPFYRKFGFSEDYGGSIAMRRTVTK